VVRKTRLGYKIRKSSNPVATMPLTMLSVNENLPASNGNSNGNSSSSSTRTRTRIKPSGPAGRKKPLVVRDSDDEDEDEDDDDDNDDDDDDDDDEAFVYVPFSETQIECLLFTSSTRVPWFHFLIVTSTMDVFSILAVRPVVWRVD
jgi:hypothetical protein